MIKKRSTLPEFLRRRSVHSKEGEAEQGVVSRSLAPFAQPGGPGGNRRACDRWAGRDKGGQHATCVFAVGFGHQRDAFGFKTARMHRAPAQNARACRSHRPTEPFADSIKRCVTRVIRPLRPLPAILPLPTPNQSGTPAGGWFTYGPSAHGCLVSKNEYSELDEEEEEDKAEAAAAAPGEPCGASAAAGDAPAVAAAASWSAVAGRQAAPPSTTVPSNTTGQAGRHTQDV